MTQPIILAFMQNQWFKHPERMETMLHKYPYNGDRHKFIKQWLFFGCLTGRRLNSALGEDTEAILWEEASPKMGGHSSSAYPADLVHMNNVIHTCDATHVITFGKIATDAIMQLKPWGFVHIPCCHPTSRGANVLGQLRDMATQVSSILRPNPLD